MGAVENISQVEAGDFDPFAGDALEGVVPTSEAQREVWLADQLGTEASLAFNESVSLRLRGTLNSQALAEALVALRARHQSLRCTVGPDGMQLLVSASAALDMPVHDLSTASPQARDRALEQALTEAVRVPFVLDRGPLLRCALYKLAIDEHLLLMTAHHIICDGWSWGLIADELGALYAEKLGLAPSPQAPDQYGDYVAWEAAASDSAEMRAHESYWLGRYGGSSLPVLDLPLDRPRAAVRSFNSKRVDHRLDAGLLADVRKLGAKAGASVFAALFTGFAATLSRLSGQGDLVIGVPAAGQAASGMVNLVGHCVNLLPVRTAVDGQQTFEAMLRETAGVLLDAFDHQTLTYGSLLKKLPLRRDPSRLPLVSVMFNVDQGGKAGDGSFPQLRTVLAANARAFENFELFVNAAQEEGGLRLECQYNTDLFDEATVQRWMSAYEALLRSAVREPACAVGRLDWLAREQRDAIEALQPARAPAAAGGLMHGAFARQAAVSADSVALGFAGSELTYRQLDQRSNRLARSLRARGLQRGERVGLCVERGTDMVVALLAVLKAGACYVPLDPGFPPARLAYYAEDAQLALLLTQSTVAAAPLAWRADAAQRVLHLDQESQWADEADAPLEPGPGDARPEDAAYVIYTSGSTGKPKGVAVPHRAVANFLASMVHEPGIAASDVLAAVTTLSFDIAVLELMLPLCVGGRVEIVPRETAMDGNALRALLESSGATLMQATPGMWRMLLDTPWNGGRGFTALVGGESLPADLAVTLAQRAGSVWNMYGPTETTVWSTLWKVSPTVLAQRGVSIGRPIANTSVWILDADLQPCPIGVPGEICIGGDGVALGYLERPELTADRFVADSFSKVQGARLYRTGDRGRWRNDGLLEHLGRLDFQVKVRGYRIELGEIEAACNQMPGVTHSVALAREDVAGDVRIVVYLTLAAGAQADHATLREHLRPRLPEYMLPQHVVVLEALPRLPNGKIDRKSLPVPEKAELAGAAARVAPRNELERQVLTAMEEVLNLPGLGVHDDFFALGGHSLLAARLTSRLNRDLELNLPLRTVFQSASAETLAAAIIAARGADAPQRQAIRRVDDQHTGALTVMQERIRFMEQMHPGRVVYNTPSAHRLAGAMDVAAFGRAFAQMVQRQSGLRTVIEPAASGHGHVQRVCDEVDCTIPFEDLAALGPQEREAELLQRMQAIVDQPMDISRAPLFRVALYRMAEHEHVFLFMPHHIVWDGWSFDLLYQEMSALYPAALAAQPAALAEPPVSYIDYANWHNEWLQSEESRAQIRFWKDRYQRFESSRALPTDHARRAGMTGEGAVEWVHLDKDTTERLREVARAEGATINMLVMAVYSAMLSQATSSSSLVLGVPVRGRLIAEVETVMGFFNNLLPIPLDIDRSRSLAEWLRTVRADLLDAFANQDVPFETLAAEPELARHAHKAGLYQSLFSFQDARERSRAWGGLNHSSVLLMQKGATEDLGLWLMEVPSGLEGGINYNADLYDAATARMLRERLIGLLRRVAHAPGHSVDALLAQPGDDTAAFMEWVAQAEANAKTQAQTNAENAPSAAGTPQNEVLDAAEQQMAQIWAELLGLGVAQMSAQDNFFDLGGSSLLVMRAVAQIEKTFGWRIDPRRFIYENLSQISAGADPATPPATPAAAQAPQERKGLFSKVFGGLGKKS